MTTSRLSKFDLDRSLESKTATDCSTHLFRNIGEVSMQVKSRILPTQQIMWSVPSIADFTKRMATPPLDTANPGSGERETRKAHTMSSKRTNTGSIKLPSRPQSPELSKRGTPTPTSLLRFAVYTNDLSLLKLLLELGSQYTAVQPDNADDDRKKFFEIPNHDFDYALEVGHAHLVAEIVNATGAGIPLTSLAKKYGAELKEKPKYYQGLTVHGRKRKDWAQAGHDLAGYSTPRNYNPPLLTAAHFGSLETVEWFLSDSPLRCYREFAEANKDDKRLKQLSLSKTGFQGTVESFLIARSHTVIHCCLAGDYTAEADSLLRYLLEAMPDAIEAKSAGGFTPLQVAFELYREDWAKLLIDAGANQTCRDASGRNILHSLLDRHISKDEEIDELKRMLDIIDKRVLQTLFVERSTGSLTPLQYWLNGARSTGDFADRVLTLILEYGGGKELSFISGEGDTPLHHAVKTNTLGITRVIVEHDPTLLSRENATGRTPYEMAEDKAIARICNSPPPMPSDYSQFRHRRATRFGLKSGWLHDLIDQSPKTFVEELQEVSPGAESIVWNLLQETKARLEAEGNSTRRLVTLNEANEVAKRLAAMKASTSLHRDRTHDEGDDGEEDDGADEVGTYMNQVKREL